MRQLVDYSSSSSDEDQPNESVSNTLANKPIAKLPNPIRETTNDSSAKPEIDSNGRVRTFAHERGIWATYVYAKCPRTDAIASLQNQLVQFLYTNYKATADGFQIHTVDELHMSLTRTVILRHHWIDEFIRSIQNSVHSCRRMSVTLSSLKVFCNDERTRTFIALALDRDDHVTERELNRIVQRLDSCLAEFKLPPFYQNASFHVSILWCVGDKQASFESILSTFRSTFDSIVANDTSNFQMFLDTLKCKTGNKQFIVPFS